MEHRKGVRIPANFCVELWRGSKFFSQSLTANIGQGGLFLSEVECAVSEGDLLTLKISNSACENLSDFQRKAMVVHVSDSGIGLMWADNYSNFLTKLNGMSAMVA